MSEPSFDANKFAAEIIIQAANQAMSSASRPLRNGLRRTLQTVTDAYRPFLYRTYVRVKSIRTFLRPTESVDLLSHYVPVDLRTESSELAVTDLIDRLSLGGRYVISALAGSGKSVLMRYIALSFFHSPKGRIPLFFELRALNGDAATTILSAIHEFYRGNSSIEFGDFERSLRNGYFVLILDGFDEVSPSNRNQVEKEIIKLAHDFEKLPIVISGRHDERFNSWESFSHFYLKPMTLGQTRELIRRSNYDQNVKDIFLERLTEDFYETHQSFLENPLLAIMMMITFEGYAEIPDSLHEFYRIAFDTLLRRHDAMKGQFLRQSHSACSTEQFKQIFSSFSVLTYSKSAFAFDRDRAVTFLRAAITQQGFDHDSELVLCDLIESICLLQQEGFEVSFVHRSFQEYFCAVFIANSGAGFVKRYLDEADFRTYDNVLPMLMGIAQQRVESEWAFSRVTELCDQFPLDSEESELKLFTSAFPEMEFIILGSGAAITSIAQTKLSRDLRILQSLYADEYHDAYSDRMREDQREPFPDLPWEKAITEALIELEDAGSEDLKGIRKAVLNAESGVSEREKFVVRTDSSCERVFKVLFRETYGYRAAFFHHVAKVQRERQARSNTFIGEVFGSLEI